MFAPPASVTRIPTACENPLAGSVFILKVVGRGVGLDIKTLTDRQRNVERGTLYSLAEATVSSSRRRQSERQHVRALQNVAPLQRGSGHLVPCSPLTLCDRMTKSAIALAVLVSGTAPVV